MAACRLPNVDFFDAWSTRAAPGFYAAFRTFNSTFYLRRDRRAFGSRTREQQASDRDRRKGAE
jgi:hypothetical protein